MVKPPTSYHEWSECLEIFASGLHDEVVIKAMNKGTLDWSDMVAHRVVKRLFEVVDQRLARIVKQFRRDIEYYVKNGQGRNIVKAVMDVRMKLKTVALLLNVPAFQMVKNEFIELIGDFMEQLQSSLEDSASYDHTGRMSSYIKNNPIKFDLQGEIQEKANSNMEHKSRLSQNKKTKKRRVMFE